MIEYQKTWYLVRVCCDQTQTELYTKSTRMVYETPKENKLSKLPHIHVPCPPINPYLHHNNSNAKLLCNYVIQ